MFESNIPENIMLLENPKRKIERFKLIQVKIERFKLIQGFVKLKNGGMRSSDRSE